MGIPASTPEPPHHDWPTAFKPSADFLRKRKCKTILSIDGGGLRGMLAARLLEDLEVSLKELIIQHGVKDTEGQLAPKDGSFNIDLADFFDVMAGTSTGAVIATYLATKGQASPDFLTSDPDVLGLPTKLRPDAGAALTALHKRYGPDSLRPGSCRAAQAVFLAKARTIFKEYTGPFDWVAQQLNTLSRGRIPQLHDLFRVKFHPGGIDDTLRGVFGGDATLGNQGDGSCLSDRRLSDTLHTSLVIPAFQLNATRTLTFWHKHVSDAGLTREEKQKQCRRNTGYATLRRGASPAEVVASGVLMGEWLKEQIAQHMRMQKTPGIPDIIYVPNTDFNLWQVLRATTAAPTFFPPCTMKPIVPADPTTGADWVQHDTSPAWRMVDGGVAANDPTMSAIAFASSAFDDLNGLDDLAVLSIGCGCAINSITVSKNAGSIGWALNGLIDVLRTGNAELSSALSEHFVCKKYSNKASDVDPSDRYVRIQNTILPFDLGGPKEPAMVVVDRKGVTTADLLNSMDVPDYVPYYHRLAEVMLNEETDEGGRTTRQNLRKFAHFYLLGLPKESWTEKMLY